MRESFCELALRVGANLHRISPDFRNPAGQSAIVYKAKGRQQLENGMEQRKELEMSTTTEPTEKLRRGWCWGRKVFGRNFWK